MLSREKIKEAARAELARRASLKMEAHPDDREAIRAAARAELARRQALAESHPSQEEFSYPRFIAEKTGKGLMGTLNMIQGLSQQNPMAAMASNYETPVFQTVGNLPDVPLSQNITDAAANAGIDLESQGEGETPIQRMVGKGAEFLGGSLIPGGGVAGLARNAAIGTGMGLLSGGLREAGVPEPVADVLGIAAPLGAYGAAKGAAKLIPTQAKREANVGKYLQETLGPEETANVIKNIETSPTPEHISYEPLTAEIAESPALAQLYRVRQSVPGTGYSERLEQGNEALGRALEKHTLDAMPSEQIKGGVSKELTKRQGTRREATQPGYEAVEKMKEKVSPTRLMEYLTEKPASGRIKKDLQAIKRELEIKPPGKTDMAYKKIYENASPSVKEQMKTPEVPGVSINKLVSIDQSITAEIERLATSKQKSRIRHLKEAQEALRKDLDVIEPYASVREKYAALSKPVSEILEHPVLKNVPKNRVNDMMSSLFSKKSADNMGQLKKVLGTEPNQWKEIQDAAIEYLERRITNPSSTGRGMALSYPKLNRFLEQHHKALSETLSPEQLGFLNELKWILRGRQQAMTLGEGMGSPTQARLRTELGLQKGLGLKGLEYSMGAVKSGMFKKATRALLGRWIENHEKQTLDLLDETLKNPEFMKELLRRDFTGPSGFNKFMQQSLRQSTRLAAHGKKEGEQ